MKVELQAKPYGIKLRCYWECLREKLENLMGTCWEHIGNKGKTKKQKTKTPSSPPTKGEKEGPSGVHGEPSHSLHEFSHSKTVSHH